MHHFTQSFSIKKILLIIFIIFGIFRLAYFELVFPMVQQNYANLAQSANDYEKKLIQKNTQAVQQAYQDGATSFENFDHRTPLLKKTISNRTYTAYPLFDSPFYSLGQTLIVIHNGERPILLSTNKFGFSDNKLFDGFDDILLVVNSQHNSIDEYQLSQAEYLETPLYITSYGDKTYKLGTIYGITCQNKVCTIETAFHQEAGCSYTFNFITKHYSIPLCKDHNGSTIPLEKL